MKKIICPQCEEETRDKKYCDNCGFLLKKRKWPFILLVLLLILYFVFSNIVLYVEVPQKRMLEEEFQIEREVTVSQPIKRNVCKNRSFRFSTFGGTVDSIGNSARPNLRITNKEEKWGLFKVNFSFIDEELFPYDIYGGQNLKSSLAEGSISYDDASFYSNTYVFYLGPGEQINVNEGTNKPDPTKKYWAIAYIEEPQIEECSQITEYVNKTENRTFTETRSVEREIKIKEYRSLLKIMKINNFMEWIILCVLFLLIILLIQKIRYKLDKLNIERD